MSGSKRVTLPDMSELAEKYPMPPKYELALEEGNGETAKRLLALLASGEKSRSELAAELGSQVSPGFRHRT